MPREKKTRNGFIATRNKKLCNWTFYYKKVGLLHMDIKSFENAGYVTSWQLDFDGKIETGYDIDSLNVLLHYLCASMDLKRLSSSSNEVVLIYVDKLDKLRGFLSAEITEDYGKSLTLLDHIEVREWKDWITKESLEDMQAIVDKIFIPEKYFYLTPNQRTRKQLLKICDTDIYKDIYPADYTTYQAMRKALFGGICYVKCPGLTIEHPMLCLDIKSAYIFSLLIEKHCMTKAEKVKPDYWEYFLDAKDESSFGLYEIKYSTASTIVHCYKDINSENFKKGEHTVKVWMNSTDLKLFMDLPKVYVHEVKCFYLEKYKMSYLPDYVRQYLVKEYVKKSKIDEDKEPALYALQKVTLNGIYGNTIKKVSSKNDFFTLRQTTPLAPQWGIWTTSYTKKLLLGLATQLQGWYYSDTDSIYCLDTPENRAKIYAYNEQIQQRVLNFCKDDEKLFACIKNLGSFERKHSIKKFKALKQKEYLFTDIDDIIHVKAAGCNKEQMPKNDHLYELDKLPVGTRVFPKITKEKTEAIIDGVKYVSDGSYYEKVSSGSEAEFELWRQAMINDFFDK